VTKKQKTILGCFGLADTDVFKTAAEISTLLANNQSLLRDTNEADDQFGREDGFYGEDEINLCD
ncbi:MAG: hypothetical protein IJU50_10790, partial [Lachnospiraceae bacterium]|nr:hypothetical protein [Lachnospiraceae bacterium]